MYGSAALVVCEVKTSRVSALNTDLCLFCFKDPGGMSQTSLGAMAPFLKTDPAVEFTTSFANLSLLL